MIAYKFLKKGAVGLFTGHRWPTPEAGEPGEWVEARAALAMCESGIHACTPADLASWIDDELWVIDLAGEIEVTDDVVVATRGRLLERLDGWSAETAREFATDCVLRARDLAATALDDAGRVDAAQALETSKSLHDAQARVLAFAGELDAGPGATAVALFADTVELLDGRRPIGGDEPTDGARPSDGAIAANVGYVVAHLFGTAAAEASSDPTAYDGAFAAERARQNAWLRERLALDTTREVF